jgi:hypothetical protein
MRSPCCLLMVTVATLIVGCSHSNATPVNGPDGQPGWFSVSCKRDQGNCEERAGEVCPNGYETANASGHAGTAAFANYDSNGGTAFVVPTYHGHMLIKCHGAAAVDQ